MDDTFSSCSLYSANIVSLASLSFLTFSLSVLNSAINNNDLYQIESASKIGVKIIQIVYNRLNKIYKDMFISL